MATDSGHLTVTQRERQRSRRDVANLLALAALLAIGVGYLAMFSVLGDTNYAVRFEQGEFPPGFDGSSGQLAAVVVVAAGLFAFVGIVAAASIRTTKLVGVVIAVGLLAAIPYVPMALFTWALTV